LAALQVIYKLPDIGETTTVAYPRLFEDILATVAHVVDSLSIGELIDQPSGVGLLDRKMRPRLLQYRFSCGRR
jgi:hypothetical protein